MPLDATSGKGLPTRAVKHMAVPCDDEENDEQDVIRPHEVNLHRHNSLHAHTLWHDIQRWVYSGIPCHDSCLRDTMDEPQTLQLNLGG